MRAGPRCRQTIHGRQWGSRGREHDVIERRRAPGRVSRPCQGGDTVLSAWLLDAGGVRGASVKGRSGTKRVRGLETGRAGGQWKQGSAGDLEREQGPEAADDEISYSWRAGEVGRRTGYREPGEGLASSTGDTRGPTTRRRRGGRQARGKWLHRMAASLG